MARRVVVVGLGGKSSQTFAQSERKKLERQNKHLRKSEERRARKHAKTSASEVDSTTTAGAEPGGQLKSESVGRPAPV